jgi:predicted membrane protein
MIGVPEGSNMVEVATTSRNASRLFAGLVVFALGILALLGNFGIVRVHDVWRFWPLVLIALGLGKMLRAGGGATLFTPGRFGGVVLFIVGLWLLLENLGLWSYSIGDLWPLLAVLVGAWLVWGGLGHHAREAPADASSRLNSFAMLGGSEHHSSATDFRGGEVTAILGGCKIDLRQAVVKEGEAVLDVFAMWGGVEIIVPREWSVVVQGAPILGGFDDKTSPPRESGGPRLVVRGAAIMGGVEIKN